VNYDDRYDDVIVQVRLLSGAVTCQLTNESSASQKIPRTSWNPVVHCRIHKSTLPVTILIHINEVHASNPLLENPF
jgi:hypothetical protein